MKSKLWIIGFILSAALLIVGCDADFVDGIDAIQTENYANRRLEYYYYIPATVVKDKQTPHPILAMIPGLSGRGEQFASQEFKEFARQENLLIVAPSFVYDETNWANRQSYQYPAVWSGQALLAITNQIAAKHRVSISKMYLFGYSAGAQFALRFCLWRPELCVACAAHASGGTVIPEEKVNAKFFVTVGSQDSTRVDKAATFYASAQELGIYVVYKEYNTDHTLTQAQIKDSLNFFRSVK
jgi:poly(3-hydroxybutyrate) depolymerase